MIENMAPKTWPLGQAGLSGQALHSYLGQFDWGGGGSWGSGGGTEEMECYECPGSPPGYMRPSQVPAFSTCVQVPDERCAPTVPLNPRDGVSRVTLSVFDPVNEVPVHGANVSVAVEDKATRSVGVPVLTGVTNANGQFAFDEMAPSPNVDYLWNITVSPGSGSPGFTPVTIRRVARTNAAASAATGLPEDISATMNVCVAGSDPLVCEVADAQLKFRMTYEGQLLAWNYYSTGQPEQIARFAADMAHAGVVFTDPRLASRWETFSWWIGDQSIPARDWPALIDRVNQVTPLFDAVPFPPVSDYFIRCARGIPINRGMSIANPRFYTDAFNGDYWPRPDWRINADMAIQFLENIEGIIKCIEHKIKKKVREIEGSMRAWRLMSLAVTFALAPLAAGAAPTLLVTEAAQFGYEAVTNRPAGDEVGIIATSGVTALQADPAALEGLITIGLERILADKIEGLNPNTQQLIMGAVPALAAAGAREVASGLFPDIMASTTAGSASGLATTGSGLIAVAIQLLGDVIEAEGARGAESLEDTIFGLQNMETTMIPFTVWFWDTLLLAWIFEAATDMLQDQQDDGVPGDETVPGDGGGLPGDDGVPGGGGDLPGDDGVPGDGGDLPGDDGETPIGDFDAEDDIVDPLVDRAEADGVDVSRPGDDPLVIAGASAGGLLLVGLAFGIFGK